MEEGWSSHRRILQDFSTTNSTTLPVPFSFHPFQEIMTQILFLKYKIFSAWQLQWFSFSPWDKLQHFQHPQEFSFQTGKFVLSEIYEVFLSGTQEWMILRGSLDKSLTSIFTLIYIFCVKMHLGSRPQAEFPHSSFISHPPLFCFTKERYTSHSIRILSWNLSISSTLLCSKQKDSSKYLSHKSSLWQKQLLFFSLRYVFPINHYFLGLIIFKFL